jgi:hypothetical protein
MDDMGSDPDFVCNCLDARDRHRNHCHPQAAAKGRGDEG